MISGITWQLLAVLLVATLLGILIGLSAMRLHLMRLHKGELGSRKGMVGRLAAERDELHAQKVRLLHELESEKKLAGVAIKKQAQLAAQQETLQVHTSMQAQRVEKLTSELHASEEKCIRLQRDFASFKANKLREVRMLKVTTDDWIDNEELPVLNKKVERITAHIANVEPMESDDYTPELDQTQPIITSELDIPSLAESELPDSVEALQFELVNDDEPN